MWLMLCQDARQKNLRVVVGGSEKCINASGGLYVSAKFFVYQMCDQVKRIIVLRLILALAERSVNEIGTQEGDILFTANYKRP